MVFRCSDTGGIVDGPSYDLGNGIDRIIWDYEESLQYANELQARFPTAGSDLVNVFEELVEAAGIYKGATGRDLPVFGELGELFAEIVFGITRHKPRTQGSDGRLGNDFIEVKTISPTKKSEQIAVKRSGNFNKLVVVKISSDFHFEARMMDRKDIQKGTGILARVSWSSMNSEQAAK
jgi:hypothetical protein